METEAAYKLVGEVSDLLYLEGIRSDENVSLDVFAAEDRTYVWVSIYVNSMRCENCRTADDRNLIQRMMRTAPKRPVSTTVEGALNFCSGCKIHQETGSFHVRAKLALVVKSLESRFTLFDQRCFSSGSGHVNVRP